MQYKASTINRTALPRSKRRRESGSASTVSTIENNEVARYWGEETDPETEEVEVSTAHPIKISKRLKITDESGALYGSISLDAHGRFVFDKGIISKEDIIAYGVGGSDIKSVTDVIEEYLSEHGVGGYEPPVGGIPRSDLSSSVQASLGKADTALQEHQSLQGYATEQWVEGKGYLTSHQNISGKLDKSAWNVGRTTSQQTDWNSFTTNGNYFVHNAAVTNKPSNVDWYGQLLVLRGDTTDTITQLYFPYNGSNPVVRSGNPLKSGGNWNAWKTLAYKTDITKDQVGLGNVDNTSDANKPVSTATQTALNGKRDNTAPKSGAWFAGTPQIGSDGVMEIGRYIDFHPTSNSDLDYGCRIDAGTSITPHVLTLPNKTGTLAITTDNVASATKLQNARSLWGNSFDGSANIDGTITMGEGTDGRTVKLTNSAIKFIATSQNGWAMNLVARNHADSSDLATLIGGYGTADTYYYTYLGGTYKNPSMVILPNGNVGIGTSNPTSKLRVIGSAQIDGLNLNDCSLSDTGNITPKSTNAKNIGSSTLLYASVYANAYRANADELYITNTKSQKDIGFWINNGTNNTRQMLIRGSDGAVGIGSSSPSYRLHVAGGSVYSDTAIRVPNSKPFASKLADGTDINLLSINANNKVNVGNASYLTDVNGSIIQLYNSATEKVIIGSGNIATEVAATTDRYVRVKNSNGEVRLYTSTNRGLYDTTNSKWIACYNNATSRTELLDGKVYIGSRILTPAATSISDGGGIEVGNNKILSLANDLIFCADGLRFSNTGTNWFYNNWAGLKYDSTNKIIYLGVADGTVFTSNNPGITDGTVKLVNCGLVATGDVTAYSDKRLKSDIKDLEYRGPLEPKTYVKDGKMSIGFIAQEVREKYPELVLGEESDTEYLSLNYGAITAVLAAENKELRNEVTELKNEVNELKKLINKLIEEK